MTTQSLTVERDRPQLQLALDFVSLNDALRTASAVHPHFDIAEIGTPLIIEEGLRALEELKARWPEKRFLADTKIMDAGRIEAGSAFRRGADIVTVLALADDKTIAGALEAAAQCGGQIMADLIHVPDPAARARQLERLGVHILCVHTAYDVQDQAIDPLGELACVRSAVASRVAVAGGLKLNNVEPAVRGGADILIFGGAIAANPEPGRMAKQILDRIHEVSR